MSSPYNDQHFMAIQRFNQHPKTNSDEASIKKGMKAGSDSIGILKKTASFFGASMKDENPKIASCHFILKRLAQEIWDRIPILVFTCYRSKETQRKMVAQGKSQTMNSRHLSMPAMAMDIVPRKSVGGDLLWNDREQLYYICGMARGIYTRLKTENGWTCKIRLGCDWDSDHVTRDHNFKDPYHIEIKC